MLVTKSRTIFCIWGEIHKFILCFTVIIGITTILIWYMHKYITVFAVNLKLHNVENIDERQLFRQPWSAFTLFKVSAVHASESKWRLYESKALKLCTVNNVLLFLCFVSMLALLILVSGSEHLKQIRFMIELPVIVALCLVKRLEIKWI